MSQVIRSDGSFVLAFCAKFFSDGMGDSNYSFFFVCSQDELSDVIDIKDPDFTPAAERRQKRLAAELAKFDPDHYL